MITGPMTMKKHTRQYKLFICGEQIFVFDCFHISFVGMAFDFIVDSSFAHNKMVFVFKNVH